MDASNTHLIVQSPSAAAIALVMVDGETQPRPVAVRPVEEGKHSYLYGDFATQKPYIFRFVSSSHAPITNASLTACIPKPLKPTAETCTLTNRLSDDGMAIISAALEKSGGNAVLASDRFAADLDSGKYGA